jgi:hypothetical protein
MKPTAKIFQFPKGKSAANLVQDFSNRDMAKIPAPHIAPQVIAGQKWEATKLLSLVKIRDLVRLDIDDMIRARVLPLGEYEIILNPARYCNTLKIGIRQMVIERLFDPVMLCPSIDALFQSPEMYFSAEALQYRAELEFILNQYNRRIYSADGRLINSHIESGVILNSAFILTRICNETMR